jgi:hypothetical protein
LLLKSDLVKRIHDLNLYLYERDAENVVNAIFLRPVVSCREQTDRAEAADWRRQSVKYPFDREAG